MAAPSLTGPQQLWQTSKWERARPWIVLGIGLAITGGGVLFVRHWQVTLAHWRAASRIQELGGQVDWTWGTDWWRGDATTSVSFASAETSFRITDADLQNLASLRNVEQLDLANCRDVTDSGLTAIANLRHLKELDLSGLVRVTDGGLESLRNLVALRVLILESTGITDAGLRRLAGLKHLEYLDLDATAVSDAGLAALEALPELKVVHLIGTRVTEKGAIDLLRKRPRLEVHQVALEDAFDHPQAGNP